MSRLSIEISPDQHQKIKALAAIQGKSMKDFIIQSLLIPEDQNNRDDPWQDLQDFLLKRIEQAKPSNRTIEQITENSILKNSIFNDHL